MKQIITIFAVFIFMGAQGQGDNTVYFGGSGKELATELHLNPKDSVRLITNNNDFFLMKPTSYVVIKYDTIVLFKGIDTVHTHDWADDYENYLAQMNREVICTICLKDLKIKETVTTVNRFDEAKKKVDSVLSKKSNNTAFGYEELRQNTTGHNNLAVGYYAIKENKSNEAFGKMGTLDLVPVKFKNYALGAPKKKKAKKKINHNTGYGYYSLGQNTTGNSSTPLGVIPNQKLFIINGIDYSHLSTEVDGLMSTSKKVSHNNKGTVAFGFQ